MSKNHFSIHGRVRVKDDGVHGLTVDASDPDLLFSDEMGSVLTNRDGEFTFEFEQTKFKHVFDAAPKVVLTICDVSGKRLATVDKGMVWSLGKCLEADIKLPQKKVADHQNKTKTLTGSGSLFPAQELETIGAAWNELSASRGDTRTFSNNFAFCPGPPIMRFPDLVDVALDVISGQIDAVPRFQEMMMVMAAAGATNPEQERRLEIVSQGVGDSLEYWNSRLKEFQSALSQIPAGNISFIPKSGFIAVTLASALLGGRDTKALHRNLGVINEQICGLERLGPVVRAAERVRFNTQEALAGFDRAWMDYSGSCGPDDGPLFPPPGRGPQPGPDPQPCPEPWPPTPGGFPRDPGLLEKWACTAEVVIALRGVRGVFGSGSYTITSVSNVHACPGDVLTITGSGFSATAGRVMFPTSSGSGTVTATTWTDTLIAVTVPANATCGTLSLRIFEKTVEVCGRFVDINRTSYTRFQFLGGTTRISLLRFRNTRGPGCASPNTTARVEWNTCNADSVSLILRDDGGTELLRIEPAAASGSQNFMVPDVATRDEITATVEVSGPCGDETRDLVLSVNSPFNLSIDGMEVTQAIQYYRADQHLTDPADRGTDNSLQLVTNKTAWVRVYLRSGGDPSFDAGQLTGVTGTLTVERRVGGVWSTIAASFLPQNGPVTAQESYISYNAERGNLNNTLNFIVPAVMMAGLLRFSVNVTSPDACELQSASDQVEVDVNLTQSLNAAFITIGYIGPNAAGTGNLNLPAPGLGVCQAETAFAMFAYPLSGAANVRIAGSFVTNTPLNDARSSPGSCSPNWGPLLTSIAGLVAIDTVATFATLGTSWVYYGIIAGGIPVTVPGCSGIATGGLAGRPRTYAHEIGHQFGLPHAPCGNVGTPNSSYPLYQPYDSPADLAGTTNYTMASIGEYGLNTSTGTLFQPANAEDIMSYCGPRWVSVYTHNFLVNRPILVPQVIATGANAGEDIPVIENENEFGIADQQVRSRIYVLGSVNAKGELEVESIARLDSRYLVAEGKRKKLRLQLLGKNGQVIADDSLYAFHTEGSKGNCDGCNGDEFFTFAAMINNIELGVELRIIDPKTEEVLWQRSRPSKPTKLTDVKARVRGNELHLSWKSTTENKEDINIWVRWSANCGKTWNGLTAGLRGTKAVLDIAHLPGGVLKFQLMAQDGYTCVSTETPEITRKAQPPVVAILAPAPGKIMLPGAQIHLKGSAAGEGVDALEDGDYLWLVDGKEVGKGPDIWVTRPRRGRRQIELQVQSKAGVGSTQVKIQV